VSVSCGDGFEQVVVGVRGPVGAVLRALDDTVVGEGCGSGAADDADLREVGEWFQARPPQSAEAVWLTEPLRAAVSGARRAAVVLAGQVQAEPGWSAVRAGRVGDRQGAGLPPRR
jgi:hypothetical protein